MDYFSLSVRSWGPTRLPVAIPETLGPSEEPVIRESYRSDARSRAIATLGSDGNESMLHRIFNGTDVPGVARVTRIQPIPGAPGIRACCVAAGSDDEFECQFYMWSESAFPFVTTETPAHSAFRVQQEDLPVAPAVFALKDYPLQVGESLRVTVLFTEHIRPAFGEGLSTLRGVLSSRDVPASLKASLVRQVLDGIETYRRTVPGLRHNNLTTDNVVVAGTPERPRAVVTNWLLSHADGVTPLGPVARDPTATVSALLTEKGIVPWGNEVFEYDTLLFLHSVRATLRSARVSAQFEATFLQGLDLRVLRRYGPDRARLSVEQQASLRLDGADRPFRSLTDLHNVVVDSFRPRTLTVVP